MGTPEHLLSPRFAFRPMQVPWCGGCCARSRAAPGVSHLPHGLTPQILGTRVLLSLKKQGRAPSPSANEAPSRKLAVSLLSCVTWPCQCPSTGPTAGHEHACAREG